MRAGMEVNFRRDPTVYDGRFANNGWLQELPKPVTKLTWDNAALIAPATAEQLGVENGDMLDGQARRPAAARCRSGSRPGTPPDAVTISVGYGRTRAGRVGNGDRLQRLRAARQQPRRGSAAAEVAATGDRYQLVSTQDHWTLEGRNVVRSAQLEEFKAQSRVRRTRWST